MSQWIGGGKKASDGGDARNNPANGEEEPWNGISAMTVNARIMVMVRIGKEEMTTKLKGNEHSRPVAHFAILVKRYCFLFHPCA